MANYEYGIMMYSYPDELHRGPMSEEEVDEWIASWLEDGGAEGIFSKVRRSVSNWSPTEEVQEVGTK